MPLRNRSELATKFTYNPHNETWQTHKVRVVVDKKPFAQGGMRVCMKLYELEDSGDFVPCVAKVFKKETNSKEYFDEALTQMAAECFAQEFNKLKTKWKVSFLPVNVMMLNERNGQLCNVEPLLLGDYVKHNDNDGNVETSEQLPQAFTHFTWEASRHMLIVCDIQGLADCYTDPQIHSIDGQSFGRGNLGQVWHAVTRMCLILITSCVVCVCDCCLTLLPSMGFSSSSRPTSATESAKLSNCRRLTERLQTDRCEG